MRASSHSPNKFGSVAQIVDHHSSGPESVVRGAGIVTKRRGNGRGHRRVWRQETEWRYSVHAVNQKALSPTARMAATTERDWHKELPYPRPLLILELYATDISRRRSLALVADAVTPPAGCSGFAGSSSSGGESGVQRTVADGLSSWTEADLETVLVKANCEGGAGGTVQNWRGDDVRLTYRGSSEGGRRS